jgi:hypothetical protein
MSVCRRGVSENCTLAKPAITDAGLLRDSMADNDETLVGRSAGAKAHKYSFVV